MERHCFIRSQNEEKLTNDFNISIEYEAGNVYGLTNCKVGSLGRYSTLENAKYVLNEISKSYFDGTAIYHLPEDEKVTKILTYTTISYPVVFISLKDEKDTYIVKIPDLELEIRKCGKLNAINATEEAIKTKYEELKETNEPIPSSKRYYADDFVDEIRKNPGLQLEISKIEVEVKK